MKRKLFKLIVKGFCFNVVADNMADVLSAYNPQSIEEVFNEVIILKKPVDKNIENDPMIDLDLFMRQWDQIETAVEKYIRNVDTNFVSIDYLDIIDPTIIAAHYSVKANNEHESKNIPINELGKYLYS